MIWQSPKISQAVSIQMGQSPPSEYYNSDGIGIPFFQGKADFTERIPRVRKWCSQPIRIAREGDILLSVRAPVGPTNIAPSECCIGRGLAGLRAIDSLMLQQYLWYFLKYAEPTLSSKGQGGIFSAVSKSDIGSLSIPLPPLSEQQRIVDILDQADVLRKMRAEADEMMQRVLPALFYKMIGDPANNPKNWNTVSFQEAFIDDTSRRNKLPQAEYQTSGLYPVIDQGKSFIAGYYDSDSFVVRSSKPIIVFGDHTRAVKLIDFPFIAGADGSRVLRTKDGFCPEFLACQLDLLPIPDLGYSRHMREVKRLQFIKPPINLQNQFAVYYNSIRSTCINQETSQVIVESLMHTLLHRAFTGELTAKWREAHMKELLQEMEVQARELGFQVPDEVDRPIRVTDFPNPLLEKKATLLAYIILHSLEAKHQIARVKLAKQYYFVNQFMQQPVTEHFKPMAAGPLDNDIFAALDLAQDRKWIVIEPQKGNEKPLSAGVCIAETEMLATEILGLAKPQVDEYLESTKDWGWETLERWATVHVVAQKVICLKQPLSVEIIKSQISAISAWEAKLKRSEFSDENIEKTIIGLRYWGLIPDKQENT